MAGKKQAPATTKFEEFEEETEATGTWSDDESGEGGDEAEAPVIPLRDWRDVEKYREQRDLLRKIEDDYGLADIRDEGAPPARGSVRRQR